MPTSPICQLQALRDLFIIRWSEKNEQPRAAGPERDQELRKLERPGLTYIEQSQNALRFSARQIMTLLGTVRLQNACITVGIVNVAQQFSGINVLAFYSSL